ncbi:hypothetical protein PILCRDRAFT_384740 [Piloderma croceum F 1598]|uniref:Uncharacterized protein n=1 Tax=Piloderma croceum (strain F 1598) TaxID=765440 RepID=A0A0C3C4B5_PILCF|nr:hypothetical protein PILCRDRAFT_384740 [Piloderma croceum F 1598]
MTFRYYADLKSGGYSAVVPFPATRLPRKAWASLRALVNIHFILCDYTFHRENCTDVVSSSRYFYNKSGVLQSFSGQYILDSSSSLDDRACAGPSNLTWTIDDNDEVEPPSIFPHIFYLSSCLPLICRKCSNGSSATRTYFPNLVMQH